METPAVHPLAPEHLPAFLAAADGSDPFFTGIVVFVLALIVGVGILYLTLHSLPERMAHGYQSSQFQLIGILCLLALFTHNNTLWLAALVLAAFRVPDFMTPLKSISDSLETIKLQGR
ncbi:hypothetical protein ACFMPD_07325 [Sedimentitalea sp. HM32M-2]|uniref:hypothetical protein n=1 Tax=Sedimentitalea sp. HM32M-2 TaxID=3351566 RepID=UPI003643AF28